MGSSPEQRVVQSRREPQEPLENLEYAVVRSAWRSNQGRRTTNEDFAASSEPLIPAIIASRGESFSDEDRRLLAKGNVYVVADGMGTHLQGAVASQRATEMFINSYSYNLSDKPTTRSALIDAITHANRVIYEPDDRGVGRMGTTFVGGVIRGRELHLCHAGDSRAYLLRDGQLRQLTNDHSWQAAIARGERTLEQFQATHKGRREIPTGNEFYEYLGSGYFESLTNIIQDPIPLLEGDLLLLCTDGLYKEVANDQIISILQGNDDSSRACEELIAEALRNGGSDNVTALVVKIEGFDRA